MRDVPLDQRAHAVAVLGEISRLQRGKDRRNVLRLCPADLGKALNALARRDGFLIRDVGQVAGKRGIKAVFVVLSRIFRENMQRAIAHEGLWMLQQRGDVVGTLVPPVVREAFRKDALSQRAGGCVLFCSQGCDDSLFHALHLFSENIILCFAVAHKVCLAAGDVI